MEIKYSDGSAIESQLLQIVRSLSQRDSHSDPAQAFYHHWPIRYHLSSERANLLRPFNFSGLEVLELGAGMGALSRYLAENSKTLQVVEGTQARFSVLKERLSGLNNWQGTVKNIADFKSENLFDVVCVIGVLEYSELYIEETPEKSSFLNFLETAKSFLKSDGVLLLAIENRLGLKYWAGSPEDHTGQYFDGICGYSRQKTPKTFSRKELKTLLTQAGLPQIREYLPFPDYKLPSTVLGTLDSIPHSLLKELASATRETESDLALFPEALAASSIVDGGLLPDLAPSFLWACSREGDSKTLQTLCEKEVRDKEFAWHYSKNRRHPTETVFFGSTPLALKVRKQNLIESAPLNINGFQWEGGVSDLITQGELLSLILLRTSYFGNWKDFTDELREFIEWSFEHWKTDSLLNGHCLDAVIQNTKKLSKRSYVGIDLEWVSEKPITHSYFIFRNIYALRGLQTLNSESGYSSLKDLYEHLCKDFEFTPNWEEDMEREAFFQSKVTLEDSQSKIFEAIKYSLEKPFLNHPYKRKPTALSPQVSTKQRAKAKFKSSLKRILKTSPTLFKLIQTLRHQQTKYDALNSEGYTSFIPRSLDFPEYWAKLLIESPTLGKTPLSLEIEIQEGPRKPVSQVIKFHANQIAYLKLQGKIRSVKLKTPPNLPSHSQFHLDPLGKKKAYFHLMCHRFISWCKNPRDGFKSFSDLALLLKNGGKQGLREWVISQALKGPIVHADFYSSWVEKFDTLDSKALKQMAQAMTEFKYHPQISIVLPTYNSNLVFLKEALESVKGQIYSNWQLCIADDGSTDKAVLSYLAAERDPRISICYRKTNGNIVAATNSALELATGEFVGFLDHDDTLAVNALFEIVKTLNENKNLSFIYSDEDKIDSVGRRFDPHFKTDWNPELLLSYNPITHFAVYRRSLLETLGGLRLGYEGSQDYDLVLRVSERLSPNEIFHIPKVLYHWRAAGNSTAQSHAYKNHAKRASEKAIQDHLNRRGIQAKVSTNESGFHHVSYHLPESLPLVSIIIGTRDRIDLLRQVMEGLRHKTDYTPIEILIVDNQSSEKETLEYLHSFHSTPNVRVLRYPKPFNFSAINNLGAQEAKGEILAFLNNDLEIKNSNWLKEMVSVLLQKDVGAVGAKLYFPNHKIQHAGVILGIGGVAGHAHKNLYDESKAYMGRTRTRQPFSAVTGACMLVKKNLFQSVGGFNESQLAVAFNDIDLCLKIRKAGYKILWTPYAELIHHESASRGSDETLPNQTRFAKEVKYMKDTWGDSLLTDPYYNPNLTLDREDFSLAFPPRGL